MKIYVLSYLFITSLLIYGCAPNKLIKKSVQPDCETAITGYYSMPTIWNSYFPAMVLKNGYLKRAISYQLKDDGVDFVEKKSGIFSQVDTVFYPYSEITTFIDSNTNCVYGEIPKVFRLKDLKIQMNLFYLEDSTYSPAYMELEPNKTFSYCLRPGTYKIDKILFEHSEGRDKSVSVPSLIFHIKSNSLNNLGHFIITRVSAPEQTNNPNIYYVPFRIVSRKAASAFIGGIGGIVGGIAAVASNAADIYADDYYKIEIKYDEK